jgi:hypothetical protein
VGHIGEALRSTITKSDIKSLRRGLSDIKKKHETDKSGDPLHHQYIHGQHILSMFAELKSPLDEMDEYYDVTVEAEDDYQPSFPPMSPLTSSYFTLWAFLDLVFGHDKETVASCLQDSIDCLKLSNEVELIIRQMQSSRMGIYEHCGMAGGYVILHELITNKEYQCHSTSGYHGTKGEVWFVRLMPPMFDYNHHVVFTTPYVVTNTSSLDWTHFLNRTIGNSKGSRDEGLHNLMKYGKSIHYWNEYIFVAYVNFKYDVVYLTGFPDIKSSLPHANLKKEV